MDRIDLDASRKGGVEVDFGDGSTVSIDAPAFEGTLAATVDPLFGACLALQTIGSVRIRAAAKIDVSDVPKTHRLASALAGIVPQVAHRVTEQVDLSFPPRQVTAAFRQHPGDQ